MPIGSSPAPGAALGDLLLASAGILGETVPRGAVSANSQFASGALRAAAVELRGGVTVANITCQIGTAGVAVTHFWLALYDSTNALRANSADSPSSAQGTGMVTLAMGTPYVIPSTGIYYLALLHTFTTSAAAFATAGIGALPSLGAAIGSGAAIAYLQNGLAALPNPSVPVVASIMPWLAAS